MKKNVGYTSLTVEGEKEIFLDLSLWCCDKKEVAVIARKKIGNPEKSKRPCHRCTVSGEKLHNLKDDWFEKRFVFCENFFQKAQFEILKKKIN
jgi:hypothetical protein